MNGMHDNQNTLSGKVIKILELISGDSKRNPGEKWYRQEFVIETYAQYPRQVCFQIWGEDKIKAANLQLGEDVTVTFELSSREYMEKWYTSAEARNIMKGIPQQYAPQQPQGMGYGAGYPQQGGYQQPQGMPGTNVPFGGGMPQQPQVPQQGGSDDLPF